MTSQQGFPPQTVYQVTNISQANPGVVTLASVANPFAFAMASGQTVTLSKMKGMNQLNDNRFNVVNLDTNAMTFELYTIDFKPVDTSTFTAYVSGGQVNIITFPGSPPGLMFNNE